MTPQDNPYLHAVGDNLARFTPLDPRNESRADELTLEQLMGVEAPPQEYCPHCGAPLVTLPFVLKDGTVIGNNMYPEPCTNPACIEAEAKRQKQFAAERRAEKRREKQREYETMLRESIGGSGIAPQGMKHYAFDAYVPQNSSQKRALQTCREYAESFSDRLYDELKPDSGDGMGLYLYGPYGTGKTHLVQAVGSALLSQLYGGIVYRTDALMLADIRKAFDSRRRSERDTVDVFMGCNLLIIDDLGKAKYSEWALQTLYEIIDTRYAYRRPVIIASNYGPEEIVQRMGAESAVNADRAEAIMSRLYDRTYPVQISGADYRRRRY